MNEQKFYELVFKTPLSKSSSILEAIGKLSRQQRAALTKISDELGKNLSAYLDYVNRRDLWPESNFADLLSGAPTIIDLAKKNSIRLTDASLEKNQRKYYKHAALAMLATSSPSSIIPIFRTVWNREINIESLLVGLAMRTKSGVDRWLKAQSVELIFSDWYQLVQGKLCSKPPNKEFIESLVSESLYMSFGSNDYHFVNSHITLTDYLKENAELLKKDIWEVFYVETDAFNPSRFGEDNTKSYHSWTKALSLLYSQGYLDKRKLISAVLDCIKINSHSKAIANLESILNLMAPSLGELNTNLSRIDNLLRHKMDAGVRLGIKLIKELYGEGLITLDEFLKSIEPVMKRDSKSQVIVILKILERIMSGDEAAVQIFPLLSTGLMHSHEDVQEKALDLITHNRAKVNSQQLLSNIKKVMPLVNAKIKRRISALLDSENKRVPDNTENNKYNTAPMNWGQISTRIKSLSSYQKESVGLLGINKDISRQNYKDQWLSIQHEKELLDYDVCEGEQHSNNNYVVKPLRDAASVLEHIGKIIEDCESGVDIEQLFDGISRFSCHSVNDFDLKAKPLLKRIDTIVNNMRSSIFDDYEIIRELVTCWLGGIFTLIERYYEDDCPPKIATESFIHCRITEILNRRKQNILVPLLAMPTYKSGFIDCALAAAKLRDYEDADVKIGTYDFMQMLLRLDSCSASRSSSTNLRKKIKSAIDSLKKCSSIHAKILRFALGDNIKPTQLDKTLPLWLTAARVRNPSAATTDYCPFIEEMDNTFPGITEPNRLSIQIKRNPNCDTMFLVKIVDLGAKHLIREYHTIPKEYLKQKYEALLPYIQKAITPYCESDKSRYVGLLPTLLAYDCAATGPLFKIRWYSMLWPSNLDYYFISSYCDIVFHIDDNSIASKPNFAYLEPLFNKNTSLTRPALLVLVFALNSKDQDLCRLAIDLCIELVEDLRISTGVLFDYLRELTEVGFIKPNRIGAALEELASISFIHCHFVREALDKYFGAIKEYPRNSHILLQVFRDSLIEREMAASLDTLTSLKAIKGSSKLAKVAKEIIAQSLRIQNDIDQRLEELNYILIDQRISIAENR